MATDGGGVDSGRQVAGTARGSGGEGAGWGWGGPREKDRRGCGRGWVGRWRAGELGVVACERAWHRGQLDHESELTVRETSEESEPKNI